MNKKQEEALLVILREATKLGATLGTWLDSDIKFTHRAAHSALAAMMPHFIDEINQRFRDIEQEESGRCRFCGRKDKEDE
jgi:ABC-type molybdate transport system permease subunit